MGDDDTTIIVEHECGDLDTCAFTNDGDCDDGGPGAKYWECRRYADASDCGTKCALAAAPPPPPCVAREWGASAYASSSASAAHLPSEATGPPTHHLTCAPQLAGSWVPDSRNVDDNWLAVEFATPMRVASLTIYEHAEPSTASGFVTSVDVHFVEACEYTAHEAPACSAAAWVQNAWVVADDTTPCGEALVLRASDARAADALSTRLVDAVKVHVKATPSALAVTWEHIDAVQLEGTTCAAGAPSEGGTDDAGGGGTHKVRAPPPPGGASSALPSPPPSLPPAIPGGTFATNLQSALTSADSPYFIFSGLMMVATCLLILLAHQLRVRQRRRSIRRPHPLPPSLSVPTITRTASASGFSGGGGGAPERILLTLHKPDAGARLGIVFDARAPPGADAVVVALTPGSIAEVTRALRIGDTLLSVNGCAAAGGAHAAEMLGHAEGVVVLELKRPGAAAPAAAPAAAAPPAAAPAASPEPAMAAVEVMEAPAPETVVLPSVLLPAAAAPAAADADAAPLARPWTPRTRARVEVEMSAATEAGDFEQLAAVTQRVQGEVAALRHALSTSSAAGGPSSSAAADGGEVEVPAQYRCPISQEVMEDPVCTADGHTYERREIFRWLCKHDTSPLTGAPLPNKALTPNIGLRQVIAAWRAEHPEVEDV
jgi:hypothetical protein